MQAKKSFRFWLVVGIVCMSVLFAPISNGTFASNNTFIGDCYESPDQCKDTNTSDDDTESSESSSVSMGPWEYIKILLALVFVIGLLLFVLKFLNKRNIKYQQNSVIKNVGGMSVGPQKSVQLLLIGNKIYVVGVGEDSDKAPLDIWRKALENVTPQIEVKSRRIGGANFQVPTELRPERKISLSMKNMILFARKRSGHSMAEKLCAEIVAAYNNEGGAFKRKEDMHRMAEANKAFAHFRF